MLPALMLMPLLTQQPIDLRSKNFRAGSELVTTAVTVRDGDGRLVTSLEKGDFIIEEDGVAQPITQFTKERVPISLSLTLDISDSMRGQRMSDARAALAHFLDALLAEDDEASLLGFNHETRMFGQWTTERASMRAKLEAIRPSGGTALYDAIDAALPLFESRQHPRAAILLVSDGADTASDTTPTALKQKLVTKKNRKVRLLQERYPGVNVRILYQRDYLNLLVKYGLESPEQLAGYGDLATSAEQGDSLLALGLFDRPSA